MLVFIHKTLLALRQPIPIPSSPSYRKSILSATLIFATILCQLLLSACAPASSSATATHPPAKPQTPGIFVLRDDDIIKLDPHTHKVLWRVRPDLPQHAVFDLASQLASDGQHLYISAYIISTNTSKHDSPQNVLYSFDEQSGRQLWSQNLPAYNYKSGGIVTSLGILKPPVVSQGRVYVASNAGSIFALDAASGKLLWTYNANIPGIRCPAQKDIPFCPEWRNQPAIAENLIISQGHIYSSIKNQLFELDATTGHLLWSTSFPSGQQIADRLVLANGQLYTITYTTQIHALTTIQHFFVSAYQASDGTKIWQTHDFYPDLSFLIVQNAHVCAFSQSNTKVSAQPGGVYTWNAQNGQSSWSYTTTKQSTMAPPLLAFGDTLIFSSITTDAQHKYILSNPVALNAQNGQLRWQGQPSFQEPLSSHSPSLYSLQIQIPSTKNPPATSLVASNPMNGQKQWQQTLPPTSLPYDSPVILDVLVQS